MFLYPHLKLITTMNPNKKITAIALITVVVLSFVGSASAKRILFYEVGTRKEVTIQDGYKKLAEELRLRGFDVATMTKGELSKETLKNYDILVMQDLRNTLKTDEISAILWFVVQEGNGLFVNGGDPAKANQVTIPFGITVDEGTLIDNTNPIPGNQKNSNFIVSRFEPPDEMRVIKQGVSSIGFYEGNGLFLSGNAIAVATGDTDTYSDTGSFSAGSKPPIGAGVVFGNGLVFVLTDADIFRDTNIGSFSNKNFGINIIEWLGISKEQPFMGNKTEKELYVMVGELKLENTRLNAEVERLEGEKKALIQANLDLTTDLGNANNEIEKIKTERVGPFTKTNWATIILGACILIAAVIISKRKKPEAGEEEMPLGELGELGYELGGEDESKKDLGTKDLEALGLDK